MITIFAKNTQGYIVPSKAEVFAFHGGEQHLRVPDDETPWGVLVTGADLNELIAAGLVNDWAKQQGHTCRLLLPYLPAARADRGVPFSGKVYADVINSLGFDQVIIFDPHSPAVPALVNNVTIVNAADTIKHALFGADAAVKYAGIICPDQGATERTQRIADAVGLPVIHARKHRDFDTGKLSGFTCDPVPDPAGVYLVVDDICDGGGTFMGLAGAVGLPKEQLHLWISHGVFSGRAPQLRDAFDRIITTDSHPGHDNPGVGADIITILPYLTKEVK